MTNYWLTEIYFCRCSQEYWGAVLVGKLIRQYSQYSMLK
jgi:hypothetical protein